MRESQRKQFFNPTNDVVSPGSNHKSSKGFNSGSFSNIPASYLTNRNHNSGLGSPAALTSINNGATSINTIISSPDSRNKSVPMRVSGTFQK